MCSILAPSLPVHSSQRRSGRNTTRKKYTEDYDFKITDDESSSSSDNNDGKKQSSKHQKKKSSTVGPPRPPQPVVRSIKVVKQEVEADSAADVDVESVEPSAVTQGTQFFVVRFAGVFL